MAFNCSFGDVKSNEKSPRNGAKHRNFSRNRPELVLKNGPKLLRICPEIGANFAEIFFKFDAKFILKLSANLSVFGSILVSKTGFFPEMSIFA